MRGLFIINAFSVTESTRNKVERLTKIFNEYNCQIDTLNGIDIISLFTNGSYKLNLKNKYDFCLFLDKDKYLSEALEDLMPVFNSASAIEIADDKMLTYTFLRNHGILTPLTIASPLNYNENFDWTAAHCFLDKVEDNIKYPLVVKKVYGSLGKQVYLVNNRMELEELYQNLYCTPHIYQEYIGTEFGTDYRIFTIAGKTVACMKRTNPYDFRSNIALGGHGESIELPPSFTDLAEKVSNLIGLDYAGIDILKNKNNEPVFNEVNSNAFFKEIEKVSGIDISRRLVEHIIAKVTK